MHSPTRSFVWTLVLATMSMMIACDETNEVIDRAQETVTDKAQRAEKAVREGTQLTWSELQSRANDLQENVDALYRKAQERGEKVDAKLDAELRSLRKQIDALKAQSKDAASGAQNEVQQKLEALERAYRAAKDELS